MAKQKNNSSDQLEQSAGDFLDALLDSLDSLRKTQRENRQLLEKSYEHVGKIISCHLVIENLLNTELITLGLYTNEEIQNKKIWIKFSQKLRKLPKDKKYPYTFLIPGIGQLNDIRNEFAHNLEAKIEDKSTFHIDKVVRLLRKKQLVNPSLEKRIEEFTIVCIGSFGSRHPEVMEPLINLRSKYPKFEKMWQMAAKANERKKGKK